MHVGLFGGGGGPRVDYHKLGRIWATSPVQNAHPKHRLLGSDIVSGVENGISNVQVSIGARLPIGPEDLHQGHGCGGGAKAGIAVQVGCAQATSNNYRQGIILLCQELAAVKEAQAEAGMLVIDFPRAAHDEIHGLIPTGRLQTAIAADTAYSTLPSSGSIMKVSTSPKSSPAWLI